MADLPENQETPETNRLPDDLDQNIRPQDSHYHPYYGYPLAYPYFNGSYEPWYDDRKDYNTNAPSYYDYLAHRNFNLKVMIDFINKLARRNLKTMPTNSIDLKKIGDWIQDERTKKSSDLITLKADLILSKVTKGITFGTKSYNLPNAINVIEDGTYAPDYLNVLSDFASQIEEIKKLKTPEPPKLPDFDAIITEKVNKAVKPISEKVTELETRVQTLETDMGLVKGALTKIINDLKGSGAWVGNLAGDFVSGRHIATGNINLFGGRPDGYSFIRTNSGQNNNDVTIGAD